MPNFPNSINQYFDHRIAVAKDFSTAPGPQYPKEGKHSGQEFRQNLLLPKLKQAIENDVFLAVNLDGTAGYGHSFLEESFGGLVRVEGYEPETVLQHIILISTEEPELTKEITHYIKNAKE